MKIQLKIFASVPYLYLKKKIYFITEWRHQQNQTQVWIADNKNKEMAQLDYLECISRMTPKRSLWRMFLWLFLIWRDSFIETNKPTNLFSERFQFNPRISFFRSNIQWPTYFGNRIFCCFHLFKCHNLDLNWNGIMIISKSTEIQMRKINYSPVNANTKHWCFWIAALGIDGWLLNIDWQCQKGKKRVR